MTNAVAISQQGSNNTTFRNRIINGAMVIDQRNAGASGTARLSYTVDRWGFFNSPASTYGTWGQNLNSVTPPVGFTNYLGYKTGASPYTIGASEDVIFYQSIEGLNVADLAWGTANAKTVTLSFQVYSSLTGSFGGAIQNSAGNRSYPFSYTISSANTWTSISITIQGDTTGTWLTTNGVGITVIFALAAGSSVSGTANTWAAAGYASATGSTSVLGTANATFYITGVQLEAGSTASPFEYRSYGTELALCQRYYYQLMYDDSGKYNYFFRTYSSSGSLNTTGWPIWFPATMRTDPTTTVKGTWTVSNCGQPTVDMYTTKSVELNFLSTASGVLTAYNNATGVGVTFSAEL